MGKEIRLNEETYWSLYEKYKGKNILVLLDDYLSLERDLIKCVEASCPGSSLSDCLEEIHFLEREIESRPLKEKEWLIDQMEEAKRFGLENNYFEFLSGIEEEKNYFEKRFFGEKRDDRKIKG